MPADRQLAIALGQPGSGRERYAAAMALHAEGRMSAAVLEVYRICSARDGDDPAALLAERGLATGDTMCCAPDVDTALDALLEAADRYLSGLNGPGIAEVRTGIAAARGRPATLRKTKPNAVVDAHLSAALGQLGKSQPGLADAIAAAAPLLDWIPYEGYAEDAIGQAFAKGHAFTSVIGADAPHAAADFDFGLFLIAPHVLYRDHHHKAPELYAPLTGPHGWRFGCDSPLIVKAAHQPVWNDSYAPHLTKVGSVPFLAFFGWTRDVSDPAKVLPADDWPDLEALRLEA